MWCELISRGWSGFSVNDDGKPVHVRDLIPDTGTVTADQFVEWLILADGTQNMIGSSELSRWRRELKAIFVKHMGTAAVDAARLR
jgi:hypothetical protein